MSYNTPAFIGKFAPKSSNPALGSRPQVAGSTGQLGKRAASGSLASMKPTPKSSKPAVFASKDKLLEDNYIRHLQQQIQILELETRLRSTASVEPSVTEAAIKGINPLEEMLRGLKRKYSEMQENHDAKVNELEEKITDLLSQLEEKNLQVEEAKRSKDLAKQDAITAREKILNEKDEALSELLKLQDKIKTFELDLARSNTSYERVLKDKEQSFAQVNDLKLIICRAKEANESLSRENDTLIGKIGSLQEQNESLQIRLEETSDRVSQLSVGPLKIAVKELNNEKSLLQAKIKQLELTNVQETLLRQKLTSDFEDIVQQNIRLSNEVQELDKKLKKEAEKDVEKQKKRLALDLEQEPFKLQLKSVRSELMALKANITLKDNRIAEITDLLTSSQITAERQVEEKVLLEEKLRDYERRLVNKEVEAGQLLQEKCKLVDQVKELQSEITSKESRISELLSETAKLGVRLGQIEKAYQIQSGLHGLKVADIESLMTSNLKVAESIQQFARKIPGGPSENSNMSIAELQSNTLNGFKSKSVNIDY